MSDEDVDAKATQRKAFEEKLLDLEQIQEAEDKRAETHDKCVAGTNNETTK